MIENIGLFRMAGDMARHAVDRQSHVARNVANADTPGYRATDLAEFPATLERPGFELKATRASHFIAGNDFHARDREMIERDTQASPNGNTVSLETEMMQAAGIRDQHNMALSIYANARDVIRTALGRGR